MTPVLRHIVLFTFKETSSEDDIQHIIDAFSELPSKIEGIHAYEWGLDNSPENKQHGFTHCFQLTFLSEADRDAYLPHPAHQAFGELLRPHLEDVLVVDYWAQ